MPTQLTELTGLKVDQKLRTVVGEKSPFHQLPTVNGIFTTVIGVTACLRHSMLRRVFEMRTAATIILIAFLCFSCSRSTPKRTTGASKGTIAASNEVSPAIIGKPITIRGKFLLGKIGWYIQLDNHQEVYFLPGGSSAWGSYDEMQGKLVTAIGILRDFQCPKDPLTDKEGRVINKEGRVIDWCSDYFYLEAETAQVRLIGP